MKTNPGFLLMKGNWTQRQFDIVGRIWDNLQKGLNEAEPNDNPSYPALQVSNEGDIAIIQLQPDGNFRAVSAFGDALTVSLGESLVIRTDKAVITVDSKGEIKIKNKEGDK